AGGRADRRVIRTVHLRAAVDQIEDRFAGHEIGEIFTISLAVMRIVAALALIATTSVGCGNGLFKQYEYEEDLYLSLDGSATLYVNSSIAAHNALRGTAFDSRPSARMRREGIAAFFLSPFTNVERVTFSRRAGRSFIHVR